MEIIYFIIGMGLFLLILFGFISSLKPSKPMTDYELYGMNADEYERIQTGMSKEEYAKYNKNYDPNGYPEHD